MTEPFVKKVKEPLSKRFEMRLTVEQWDRLKAEAGPDGDVSDVVRSVIDRYVGTRQVLEDQRTRLKAELLTVEAELDAIARRDAEAADEAAERERAEAAALHREDIAAKAHYVDLYAYRKMRPEDQRIFREVVEATPGETIRRSGGELTPKKVLLEVLDQIAAERGEG